MSARFILWGSVVVALIGIAIITVATVLPAQTGPGEGVPWLIPVGYFTAIIGAIGLCVGWFRKQG